MVAAPTSLNARHRWVILSLLLIGYCYYSILKKSFSILQSSISLEYKYSKADLGLISSSFSIAYGISKILAGMLSDVYPWHILFCTGLTLASISNIAISYCSNLHVFALLWAVNGLQQGFGWSGITSFVLTSFSNESRGAIWSLILFGSNVGYLIAPFLLLPLVDYFGWKLAIVVCGGGGLIVSAVVYCSLLMFHHKISTFNQPKTIMKVQTNRVSWRIMSVFQLSLKMQVKICLLIICNAFTYFLLKGMADWTGYYLVEEQGISLSNTSTLMLWNEIGGLGGSLSCGYISDNTVRRPLLVCMLFSMLTVLALLYLPFQRQSNDAHLGLCLFCAGFGVNVPKTLLSLGLRELLPIHLGGTVEGVLGLMGQFGASLSGLGIGYVVDVWGWNAFRSLLLASAIGVLVTIAIAELVITLPSETLPASEALVGVKRVKKDKKNT